MIKNRLIRKRFSRDRNADILGMPLYLFIVIIVTVVALGIIMAWLSLIEDVSSFQIVDTSTDLIYLENTGGNNYGNYSADLSLKVEDNNGNGVGGVTVTLENMDVAMTNGERALLITDGKGFVSFKLEIPPRDKSRADGLITIKAVKEDLEATGQVQVRWH